MFPVSVLGIILSSLFDLGGNSEPVRDQVMVLEIITWQLKVNQAVSLRLASVIASK